MTDFPSYPGGADSEPGKRGRKPSRGGPQPYPGGPPPFADGPSLFADGSPERPPIPPSVVNAVKLMYVGAGLSTIALIITAATTGAIRSEYKKALPHASAATINTDVHAAIIAGVITGLIGVGLWIWMARKNQAGRNWARITGTVFFAFEFFGLLETLIEHVSIISKLISVIIWAVGFTIVLLLWRRESSAYFKPKPQNAW